MYRHTHPIMIAENLSRFLYLLLIPLIRGLITGLRYGLSGWLKSAWVDLLTLALLVALAAARWFCITYQRFPQGFALRMGVLRRTTLFIPQSRVDTLAVTRPFYLKPFGAVRLRIDTKAGGFNRADVHLSLSRSAAQALFDDRALYFQQEGWFVREYRPKGAHILALSAILSNSLAGVLFFSTFISQTGRLLGEEFENRIFGTFERFTRMMAFGIPPAAAALAYMLLFGWLYTLLRNLVRHHDFCVRRDGGALWVSGGLFTQRQYSIQAAAINYVDIRQSLLTKLIGLSSVFINAVGYGKQKDDMSALIPASNRESLMYQLGLLLPEFRPVKRQLKPNPGAIFRFLGDAFWPCLLLPLATWLLRRIIPTWGEFILWVGFMSCLPAYLFLAVRIFDFASSGIGRHGGTLTLRYSRGFSLHTVIMPRDKVAMVVLRQSVFQKMDQKCDVLVYSVSEKRCRHHIRNMDRTMAIRVLDIGPNV